ncbi:hypothetical protein CYMTET_57016 [Cymbomonas tetramitiformis]|uniref:Bromo domain-containing protein n=1 Tax=Cymbomonas tetramitiformis TaxID=36881 RepID=A0AAE0EL91_9CHLO|nr:hypothetical protein CYMTET_57016 [Cymbomonas tetramitiformis]
MPKKRGYSRWNDEEEKALRTGVAKYGEGKWKRILADQALMRFLEGRTNVDLKDKWRTLSCAEAGRPTRPNPNSKSSIRSATQKIAADQLKKRAEIIKLRQAQTGGLLAADGTKQLDVTPPESEDEQTSDDDDKSDTQDSEDTALDEEEAYTDDRRAVSEQKELREAATAPQAKAAAKRAPSKQSSGGGTDGGSETTVVRSADTNGESRKTAVAPPATFIPPPVISPCPTTFPLSPADEQLRVSILAAKRRTQKIWSEVHGNSSVEERRRRIAQAEPLLEVWKAIASHKAAAPFRRGVPEGEFEKYNQLIRRPVDLTGIRRRLEGKLGAPCNASEFQRDLLLMLNNAMVYHEKDSPVWSLAVELKQHTVRQLEVYAVCEGKQQEFFRFLHVLAPASEHDPSAPKFTPPPEYLASLRLARSASEAAAASTQTSQQQKPGQAVPKTTKWPSWNEAETPPTHTSSKQEKPKPKLGHPPSRSNKYEPQESAGSKPEKPSSTAPPAAEPSASKAMSKVGPVDKARPRSEPAAARVMQRSEPPSEKRSKPDKEGETHTSRAKNEHKHGWHKHELKALSTSGSHPPRSTKPEQSDASGECACGDSSAPRSKSEHPMVGGSTEPASPRARAKADGMRGKAELLHSDGAGSAEPGVLRAASKAESKSEQAPWRSGKEKEPHPLRGKVGQHDKAPSPSQKIETQGEDKAEPVIGKLKAALSRSDDKTEGKSGAPRSSKTAGGAGGLPGPKGKSEARCAEVGKKGVLNESQDRKSVAPSERASTADYTANGTSEKSSLRHPPPSTREARPAKQAKLAESPSSANALGSQPTPLALDTNHPAAASISSPPKRKADDDLSGRILPKRRAAVAAAEKLAATGGGNSPTIIQPPSGNAFSPAAEKPATEKLAPDKLVASDAAIPTPAPAAPPLPRKKEKVLMGKKAAAAAAAAAAAVASGSPACKSVVKPKSPRKPSTATTPAEPTAQSAETPGSGGKEPKEEEGKEAAAADRAQPAKPFPPAAQRNASLNELQSSEAEEPLEPDSERRHSGALTWGRGGQRRSAKRGSRVPRRVPAEMQPSWGTSLGDLSEVASGQAAAEDSAAMEGGKPARAPGRLGKVNRVVGVEAGAARRPGKGGGKGAGKGSAKGGGAGGPEPAAPDLQEEDHAAAMQLMELMMFTSGEGGGESAPTVEQKVEQPPVKSKQAKGVDSLPSGLSQPAPAGISSVADAVGQAIGDDAASNAGREAIEQRPSSTPKLAMAVPVVTTSAHPPAPNKPAPKPAPKPALPPSSGSLTITTQQAPLPVAAVVPEVKPPAAVVPVIVKSTAERVAGHALSAFAAISRAVPMEGAVPSRPQGNVADGESTATQSQMTAAPASLQAVLQGSQGGLPGAALRQPGFPGLWAAHPALGSQWAGHSAAPSRTLSRNAAASAAPDGAVPAQSSLLMAQDAPGGSRMSKSMSVGSMNKFASHMASVVANAVSSAANSAAKNAATQERDVARSAAPVGKSGPVAEGLGAATTCIVEPSGARGPRASSEPTADCQQLTSAAAIVAAVAAAAAAAGNGEPRA